MQVLGASVVHLDSFGRARGIKHLLLESPGLHFGRLSTALAVLEQLQTLWLSATKRPVPRTPGALQLDALTALRIVALEGIVPESIQLMEGCELHITQHSQSCIEDAMWDTVLPYLRSVWLSDSCAVITALPSCLLRAGNLTRASLLVHSFGTAAAPVPLDGALAQVDGLVVQCKDLHATMPADVAWRSVSLAASNMLDLRFEDVASFGSKIPMLCFRHGISPVCCPLSSSGHCDGCSHCVLHLECIACRELLY